MSVSTRLVPQPAEFEHFIRCDDCKYEEVISRDRSVTTNLRGLPDGWRSYGYRTSCPSCIAKDVKRAAEGWVRLRSGNDWGSDFYYLPGTNLDLTGFADSRTAVALENIAGTTTDVRFDDGSVYPATIIKRTGSYSYSDMGHPVSGSFVTFALAVELHGQRIPLSPTEVDLRYDLCAANVKTKQT